MNVTKLFFYGYKTFFKYAIPNGFITQLSLKSLKKLNRDWSHIHIQILLLINQIKYVCCWLCMYVLMYECIKCAFYIITTYEVKFCITNIMMVVSISNSTMILWNCTNWLRPTYFKLLVIWNRCVSVNTMYVVPLYI